MRSDKDRIRGLRGRVEDQQVQPQTQPQDPVIGETIVEFHRRGAYVRVCAVDVASGVEGAIVGDPSVGEEALTRLAMRKLEYILKTRKRGL